MWPFGHRVGGWVIHVPAVVCTSSPSTANSLWSLATGQLHRWQLRSSTRILVEGFRARRRAEGPVMIPVVAASHNCQTATPPHESQAGGSIPAMYLCAIDTLMPSLDWAAGRSCTGKRECSSCHPPPCGSDRPQSTPRRFRFGCVCAHSNFDGGQPDADCLTPQLHQRPSRRRGIKDLNLSVQTGRNLSRSCRCPKASPWGGEDQLTPV